MAKGAFKKSAPISVQTQQMFEAKSSSLESKRMVPQYEKESDQRDVKLKRRTLDPLTTVLNCTSYFLKMRWSWLVQNINGVNYPLEVTRFYQEINLAIDVNPDDVSVLELKRTILESRGIRYEILKSEGDYISLIRELQ